MPLKPSKISEMPWTEFKDRVADEVLILPVGALEQHGRHLPLGTDALQVDAVATAVAERYGAIVFPVVSYGYKSRERSGGGETFAGTTSLDAATLVNLVGDILRQIIDDGAKRILVLDGHFENAMFLHEAVDLTMRAPGASDVTILKVLWAEFMSAETIAAIYPGANPGLELEHAGLLETSVMRHLHPDLVRMPDLVPQGAAAFPPYDRYPETAQHVPSSGALSDGSSGTAEIGARVFEECVAGVIEMLVREFGESASTDNGEPA